MLSINVHIFIVMNTKHSLTLSFAHSKTIRNGFTIDCNNYNTIFVRWIIFRSTILTTKRVLTNSDGFMIKTLKTRFIKLKVFLITLTCILVGFHL